MYIRKVTRWSTGYRPNESPASFSKPQIDTVSYKPSI